MKIKLGKQYIWRYPGNADKPGVVTARAPKIEDLEGKRAYHFTMSSGLDIIVFDDELLEVDHVLVPTDRT